VAASGGGDALSRPRALRHGAHSVPRPAEFGRYEFGNRIGDPRSGPRLDTRPDSWQRRTPIAGVQNKQQRRAGGVCAVGYLSASGRQILPWGARAAAGSAARDTGRAVVPARWNRRIDSPRSFLAVAGVVRGPRWRHVKPCAPTAGDASTKKAGLQSRLIRLVFVGKQPREIVIATNGQCLLRASIRAIRTETRVLEWNL